MWAIYPLGNAGTQKGFRVQAMHTFLPARGQAKSQHVAEPVTALREAGLASSMQRTVGP